MTKNRILTLFLSMLKSKKLGASLATCAFLFIVIWGVPHRFAAPQSNSKVATTVLPAKYADRAPKKIKDRISHLGGGAMQVAAKRWG